MHQGVASVLTTHGIEKAKRRATESSTPSVRRVKNRVLIWLSAVLLIGLSLWVLGLVCFCFWVWSLPVSSVWVVSGLDLVSLGFCTPIGWGLQRLIRFSLLVQAWFVIQKKFNLFLLGYRSGSSWLGRIMPFTYIKKKASKIFYWVWKLGLCFFKGPNNFLVYMF